MTAHQDLYIDDWFSRWDMQAVPHFDDKIYECEYFFGLLSAEVDRSRFRWLLSAFLNSAYSFFESSALTAYFRHTDDNGEPYEDKESLDALRCHVKVIQNPSNKNYVKTSGLTPLTRQLYEIRRACTHHFSLSIMATGPSLPEDFHIGNMRGEGVAAMPMCRETLKLIKKIFSESNQ